MVAVCISSIAGVHARERYMRLGKRAREYVPRLADADAAQTSARTHTHAAVYIQTQAHRQAHTEYVPGCLLIIYRRWGRLILVLCTSAVGPQGPQRPLFSQWGRLACLSTPPPPPADDLPSWPSTSPLSLPSFQYSGSRNDTGCSSLRYEK